MKKILVFMILLMTLTVGSVSALTWNEFVGNYIFNTPMATLDSCENTCDYYKNKGCDCDCIYKYDGSDGSPQYSKSVDCSSSESSSSVSYTTTTNPSYTSSSSSSSTTSTSTTSSDSITQTVEKVFAYGEVCLYDSDCSIVGDKCVDGICSTVAYTSSDYVDYSNPPSDMTKDTSNTFIDWWKNDGGDYKDTSTYGVVETFENTMEEKGYVLCIYEVVKEGYSYNTRFYAESEEECEYAQENNGLRYECKLLVEDDTNKISNIVYTDSELECNLLKIGNSGKGFLSGLNFVWIGIGLVLVIGLYFRNTPLVIMTGLFAMVYLVLWSVDGFLNLGGSTLDFFNDKVNDVIFNWRNK